MNNQKGFSLLETLFSLSISLLLIALMIKLFSLQENLHRDVSHLSQLNRHALIVRQLFSNEIQSAKEITLLNNGHEIKMDNTLFYASKNNLYTKKDNDVAVELMSHVKDLAFKPEPSAVNISITVFIPENCNDKNDTKGVCPNNRITLHFSVKFNHAVQS